MKHASPEFRAEPWAALCPDRVSSGVHNSGSQLIPAFKMDTLSLGEETYPQPPPGSVQVLR